LYIFLFWCWCKQQVFFRWLSSSFSLYIKTAGGTVFFFFLPFILYRLYFFLRMCCSSFFFNRILRLFHLTNTHRHPIIDLIRENTHTHTRQGEEKTSNFILCFALLLCVSKKKRAKRISILSFNIQLKSFCVRVTSSYIDVKEKEEDEKPMAHLTIVTKRLCVCVCLFKPGTSSNNWFHAIMPYRYFR